MPSVVSVLFFSGLLWESLAQNPCKKKTRRDKDCTVTCDLNLDCSNLVIDGSDFDTVDVTCNLPGYCRNLTVMATGRSQKVVSVKCLGDSNSTMGMGTNDTICSDLTVSTEDATLSVYCSSSMDILACTNASISQQKGTMAVFFGGTTSGMRISSSQAAISLNQDPESSDGEAPQVSGLSLNNSAGQALLFADNSSVEYLNSLFIAPKAEVIPSGNFIASSWLVNDLKLTDKVGLFSSCSVNTTNLTLGREWLLPSTIDWNEFHVQNKLAMMLQGSLEFEHNQVEIVYPTNDAVNIALIASNVTFKQNNFSVSMMEYDANLWALSLAEEGKGGSSSSNWFTGNLFDLPNVRTLVVFANTTLGGAGDQARNWFQVQNADTLDVTIEGRDQLLQNFDFLASTADTVRFHANTEGELNTVLVDVSNTSSFSLDAVEAGTYDMTIEAAGAEEVTISCDSTVFRKACRSLKMSLPHHQMANQTQIECVGWGCQNFTIYTKSGARDFQAELLSTGDGRHNCSCYQPDAPLLLPCIQHWEIYCDQSSDPAVLKSPSNCKGVCCGDLVGAMNVEQCELAPPSPPSPPSPSPPSPPAPPSPSTQPSGSGGSDSGAWEWWKIMLLVLGILVAVVIVGGLGYKVYQRKRLVEEQNGYRPIQK